MLRGDHRPRRVYPRRWTRRSISRIIRCISSRKIRRLNLTSISLMRISSINMRIIMSSLLLSRSSLILSRSNLILSNLSSRMILSSLSSMMVGVVFRGCRGWCTRPDRTTMQGALWAHAFTSLWWTCDMHDLGRCRCKYILMFILLLLLFIQLILIIILLI